MPRKITPVYVLIERQRRNNARWRVVATNSDREALRAIAAHKFEPDGKPHLWRIVTKSEARRSCGINLNKPEYSDQD